MFAFPQLLLEKVHYFFFFILYFFSNQAASTSLNYEKMKRNLTRIKTNVLPKSPKTIEEVIEVFKNPEIMKTFGMTSHNDPKLFYRGTVNEKDFAYSVFFSQAVADLITAHIEPGRRRYLMDATFKIVTVGIFSQFLIIYVEYIDMVILLSFLE